MPGYRPMVPGAPPGPYPFPPGVPRPPGMLPHPPVHPHPHPLGLPPPPPSASALGKARTPKKPKQALGAAFSRAPLIRPGLGGVPAKGGVVNGTGSSSANGGEVVDEAVRRGEHAVRMAARAAKDELSGRAPPGTTLVAATGGWGMGPFPPPPPPPPMGVANGAANGGKAAISPMGMPPRPIATAKVAIMMNAPPPEALPPHFPRPISPGKGAKAGPSSMPVGDSNPPESTSAPPTQVTDDAPKPHFLPPFMPMTFFKGTLYLDPRAYPYLDKQDVAKMQEMSIGDAMQYLLTRSASSRASLTAPTQPTSPATEESTKPDLSPEQEPKAEE